MNNRKQNTDLPDQRIIRQTKHHKPVVPLVVTPTADLPEFVLYLKKRNKEDDAGYIYLRIHYQNYRTEKSMGVYIHEELWDSNSESIINDALLTSQLQQSKLIYQQQLLGGLQLLRQTDPDAGFPHMIEVMNGRRKIHYFIVEEFEALIARMNALRGKEYSTANIQKHGVCLRHLKSYLQVNYKVTDFKFEKIDRQFIEGFVQFLKERGNNHNSSMKLLQVFKKLYKSALDNNWIKVNAFSNSRFRLSL